MFFNSSCGYNLEGANRGNNCCNANNWCNNESGLAIISTNTNGIRGILDIENERYYHAPERCRDCDRCCCCRCREFGVFDLNEQRYYTTRSGERERCDFLGAGEEEREERRRGCGCCNCRRCRGN